MKNIILLFLLLLLLSGCESYPEGTTDDEAEFFNEYGKGNAYLFTQ